MRVNYLNDMTKGWFVGNFSPTVLPATAFEVAVKHYRAGDYEARHMHRVATEITVIVSGQVMFGGRKLAEGAIVTAAPGDWTDFRALTDAVTVVVKTPSVEGDKYFEETVEC